MKNKVIFVHVEVITNESIEIDDYDLEDAYDEVHVKAKDEKDLERLMYDYLVNVIYGRADGDDIQADILDLEQLLQRIRNFIEEKQYHIDETGQCHLFELED